MVTGSNYGALVLQVFEAYKMMGSFCGIDESFKIDLFGRVSINELE